MNLLEKKWIKYKGKSINYTKDNNKIIIENTGEKHGFLVIPKIYKTKCNNINVNFEGKVIEGNSATFCIMSSKRELLGETTINSDSLIKVTDNSKIIIAIKVMAKTKVEITNLTYKESNDILDDYLLSDLNNDILVITPSYPTMENKYLCGFVHSRLIAYKKSGIKFDVICSHEYNGCCKYNFEGIDVLRVPFQQLREILRKKKYKKILVHFFDEKYATILDSSDLTDAQLYLWVHGPETLYWDWPKFTTGYFTKELPLNEYQINCFNNNDKIIKRYNEMENVHWIFVSNWIKNHSENLINIKFKNYSVIPNIIDSDNFNYVEKNVEQRKKIFFIRRFDNCNKYAIDVNIRAIMELSRREIFNDLEFNIYGTGQFYEELISPLRKFKNIHFYQKFLTHEEIAKIHKENGIGLFATRYDAQGVSMCEAAMSGLAIITSTNEAVQEFLPKDSSLVADTENYIEYANMIEKLYNDPDLFKRISLKGHESIYEKTNYDMTVKKEIDLISKNNKINEIEKVKATKSILSIIIPSYNVENYINKTITSLLECKNKDKLEIIVVNDGSKDNTVKVIKQLMDEYNDKEKPIIKLIDKENGGHGSTINAGLEKATGKYVRMIDGDDWVNSQDLDILIEKMQKEDSDIIITDYSEDLAYLNQIVKKEIYNFMEPELQYNFEDLCDENYGFKVWGPILATANFKTDMLKETNFKLTEKSFYVDMEFNMYSILKAQTIVYYPLDIYRYFIGRDGQSVSKESFLRNYKQHENILLKMIKFVEDNKELSEIKKDYIYRLLIDPMANAHYIIVSEYSNKASIFMDFDKKLSNHEKVYYAPVVNRKFIRLHRKTHGLLLRFNKIILKLYKKIKKQ